MGVRHFSRFSRSGPPTADTLRRKLGDWRPNLHLQHFPIIGFDGTGLAQEVGAETAPAPEFRRGHQAALHRISMHVTKFFDAFVFGPHIEIVEPFLPDVLREVVEQNSLGWIPSTPRLRQNASRKSELKSLHHGRRGLDLRFADQQVNVLGHDHVAGYHEMVPPAHLLQYSEKKIATARRAQQRLPPVTTAGDEVEVSRAVISL
jgi:hypothetical protein